MSIIKIRRAHTLNPAKALALAKSVGEEIESEYGIHASWEGRLMQLDGRGVQGTLHVGAKEIVLELRLGILLAAFKERITYSIERRFDEVFLVKRTRAVKHRS